MENKNEKITITRALSELKLLDSRINKEIDACLFVDIYQKRMNRSLLAQSTKENFEKNTFAAYQSIVDLISRRKKIKDAILKSNSVTIVKINKKPYTVIEAIERKASIDYEKKLLLAMKNKWAEVKTKIEKQRLDLEAQIEKMIINNLGADKKTNKEDYENIANPLMEVNAFNLIDPINIEKKIKDLDAEIDSFQSEVDFILSESNAKTQIEI